MTLGWLQFHGKNAKGYRVVHIIPNEDTFEHELDICCWCQPVVDDEDLSVVVHNSHDQRELYETGKRKMM